nr:DUF1998 domain-containing protein [Desulfobacterales bacterium]
FRDDQMMEVVPDIMDTFDPTVFIFDRYPGGVGFSPQLFEMHSELLKKARDVIAFCSCQEGCPSCVGPVNEVGRRSREVALKILEAASV